MTTSKSTLQKEDCCIPGCDNETDLKVLGYQSGIEHPDCDDAYALCEPHFAEYLRGITGMP